MRYWDLRSSERMTIEAPPAILPSDSRHRSDRNLLAVKDYKGAQACMHARAHTHAHAHH